MQPEVARSWRRLLAVGLAAAAPAAAALDLGEPQARSALGEPLDLRIPFTLQPGESADASCFALVRDPADGPGALGEGVLTVERRRGEAALRLRTVAPVLEPTVSVRIRAACPGRDSPGTRLYNVRLDASRNVPAEIAAPLVGSPTVVARLDATAGETLETMAAKVYPRQGGARAGYLIALRALNPQFAAPGAAIPQGTPVALPDPRTIHLARPARGEAPALAEAPRPEPARRAPPRERIASAPRASAQPSPPAPAEAARPTGDVPLRAERPPRAAPAPGPAAAERTAAPAPRKRAPAPERPAAGGFVLKLSSPEIDLTPSRGIDDRQRAQLRERLLVLDADDQVAAMLSMRNSLRQLEARVAEMQLKLDAMPASLAPRTAPAAVAASPKAEPPKAQPAVPEAAKTPAPPPVEAAKAPEAAKPVEPPKLPEAAKPVEPAKLPEATKPVAPPKPPEAAKPAAPPQPVAAAKPAVKPPAPTQATPPRDAEFGLPGWLWAVAAALALLAAGLGWRLWQRRRAQQPPAAEVEEAPATTVAEAPEVPPLLSDEPIEVAAEIARPQVASDSVLATRLPENAGELRRRYIEERFPEIQSRTIVLDDPASVVKGARLFYEDGALTRAVELLQFVIEERPGEVRPWLALFEIFRLERLPGEFAHLAERFREHHGQGPYWRKVQYFGREIDPGNALYREEPLNTLETIGPREAKRLAAGGDAFDPIAENWLEAPMDFENEVLANELRMKLMAGAALTEQDLAPNPMPALRNIEMFTVA